MNLEYKVGYLWKCHDEDPGQRSWNGDNLRKPLGRNEESARADCWFLACRQSSVNPAHWRYLKYFLDVSCTVFSPGQLYTFHFSSFPFAFFFLSLVHLSLKLWREKKGCPPLIQRPSGVRTEDVITGEVSGRAGTAAYKFRNSVSEDSAQS